jgi:hypothetical protein
VRPSSARELWTLLVAVFPSFASRHGHDDIEAAERDDVASLHSVMMPFAEYFGSNRDFHSEKQLRALGAILDEAVRREDGLENAVSTCFLEHLRQIRSYHTLAPYLSKATKSKTRA